jgi:deoxycytidine triphosphate deaminase
MTQMNPNEVLKRGIISDLFNIEEQVQQNGVDLSCKEDISIPNGGWLNFEYHELFDMQNTFGLIRIRSSLARKGFILQSGVFDSGFKNRGGCVIHNFSGKDASFPKGFRVAQMIVLEGNPAKMYDGYYNKNNTIRSQYDNL